MKSLTFKKGVKMEKETISIAEFSQAFAAFKVKIAKDFDNFYQDEKAVQEILNIGNVRKI